MPSLSSTCYLLLWLLPQLHTAISEFERQKLELEHTHSQKVRQVLEEANQRVAKMELEYKTQIKSQVSQR